MDIGSNAPGTRPVNFVFCSGDAQPLKLDGTDRRFWIVDAAKAAPLANFTAPKALADKSLEQRVNAWLSRPLPITGDDLLTRAEQHTSRSAPKCCDCAHYVLRGGIKPACNHPSQPVTLEEGEPWVNPMAARLESDTCQQRGLFFCSPSAVGFHPRVG